MRSSTCRKFRRNGSGGRIYKASAAPVGSPWIWTLAFWHHEGRTPTHGYAATREAAILEFGPEEWHFLPQYDVAVIPMPFHTRQRAAMITTGTFVHKEMFDRTGPLGVGSDVFMIGRFIDHDGGQTTRPAARFGHISVLPAPIIQPNRVKADSFCIDMHSRTGHSGSPVFVYRTSGSEIGYLPSINHGTYFGLLGIHWGQFPELWEIEKGTTLESYDEAGTLITEGDYVKGLSGMACVLPAWSVLEVLKMPTLVELRRENSIRVFKPQFEKEGPVS